MKPETQRIVLAAAMRAARANGEQPLIGKVLVIETLQGFGEPIERVFPRAGFKVTAYAEITEVQGIDPAMCERLQLGIDSAALTQLPVMVVESVITDGKRGDIVAEVVVLGVKNV